MAIGGDQGGSIRIPASWCGIVGLKPTWGLVPYTGAVPIETTCDHLGPMTRTVRDCAVLLEVKIVHHIFFIHVIICLLYNDVKTCIYSYVYNLVKVSCYITFSIRI
jgi:hypothetical protein